MKFLLLSFTALFFTSSHLFADSRIYSEAYNEIQSVEMFEITDDKSNLSEDPSLLDHEEDPSAKKLPLIRPLPEDLKKKMQKTMRVSFANIGKVVAITKELIAVGKEVYEIIEAGKPVVEVDSGPISVLPRDARGKQVDAFYLTQWKSPKVKKYRVVAKNILGMKPVVFEFMLIYTPGGKYNGKGSYLSAMQIKPTKVSVAWGYSVNANFKVQSIVNQGTKSNPVAAAVLMLDYSIKTVVKESRTTQTFVVNGKGKTSVY